MWPENFRNRGEDWLRIIEDHAEKLTDLPDEYLRDIGPVIKKIALATGVEQYNIIQVSYIVCIRTQTIEFFVS